MNAQARSVGPASGSEAGVGVGHVEGHSSGTTGVGVFSSQLYGPGGSAES
ncbi:hypothetical protein RKD20_003008 [Streptomyces sp. SLBN-8D4]